MRVSGRHLPKFVDQWRVPRSCLNATVVVSGTLTYCRHTVTVDTYDNRNDMIALWNGHEVSKTRKKTKK